MVTINDKIYMEVAQKLLYALEGINYFNGTVEVDQDDVYTTLRCTLIVYHKTVEDPTGNFSQITDIVPIWWEFTTTQECGTVNNDFSWRELKEYLM